MPASLIRNSISNGGDQTEVLLQRSPANSLFPAKVGVENSMSNASATINLIDDPLLPAVAFDAPDLD